MTDSTDFEDLLDHANLGKEPSASYKERLDALDNIVRECMHVSHRYGGIPAPTSRHFYASVLFTSLITKGVSLVSLAPHSPWAAKQIEHWDYATAAGIARTMLEARLVYYYLCTDQCPDDEWQCRWNILNLHDCTARRRLFDALGQSDQVAGFDQQADEIRERLKENSFFNSLPGGQKKILNGQTTYLMPLEDIAERAGLEKTTFRYLYILLSSHVHSLPMSFYRMGGDEPDRGRGLPSPVEENYTTLCLSLACTFLTKTRDEVHVLFAGLAKQKDQNVQEKVEEKISEALVQPDKFPVGKTIEIFQSKEVKVEVKHVSEDQLETSYYHVPSGGLVLRRLNGEDTAHLQDLDPFFWTVEVNGEAATEAIIDQIGEVPYAFKVDHVERKLALKTER